MSASHLLLILQVNTAAGHHITNCTISLNQAHPVTAHCATTQSLHAAQQHSHYTLCNNIVTTHCVTVTTHCVTTVTTHCATTQSLHAAQQHFIPITTHCETTWSPHAVQQQFSSKWYLMHSEKPICAPPHLSEVFPTTAKTDIKGTTNEDAS